MEYLRSVPFRDSEQVAAWPPCSCPHFLFWKRQGGKLMLLTVLPLELQILPPCISDVRGQQCVCVGGLFWKEERDFFEE